MKFNYENLKNIEKQKLNRQEQFIEKLRIPLSVTIYRFVLLHKTFLYFD